MWAQGSPVDELNQEFERLYAVSGWNQARIARELQLHPSVISRYRKGRAKPSLTVLSFFAAKLGQKLLLPGTDSGTLIYDGPPMLEPFEREFVDQLRRFHPSQRREIVRGLSIVLDAVVQPVTFSDPSGKFDGAPLKVSPLDAAAAKAAQDRREALATALIADELEKLAKRGKASGSAASGPPTPKGRIAPKGEGSRD